MVQVTTPATVLDADWLGTCRRAVRGLRGVLEEHPTTRERIVETGTRGEGGDRTLVIDSQVEDAVFVQVAVPSREQVEHYRILRDYIERLVGRINGDLGRIGRPAISYLHSSYPRHEMAALFRAADVCVASMIAPFMPLMS